MSSTISDYKKKKTIILKPSPNFYYDLGDVMAKTGRAYPAISDYEKAITLDPRAPGALVDRGVVYMETGRTGPAAADFKQACGMGCEKGFLALQQMEFNRQGID